MSPSGYESLLAWLSTLKASADNKTPATRNQPHLGVLWMAMYPAIPKQASPGINSNFFISVALMLMMLSGSAAQRYRCSDANLGIIPERITMSTRQKICGLRQLGFGKFFSSNFWGQFFTSVTARTEALEFVD